MKVCLLILSVFIALILPGAARDRGEETVPADFLRTDSAGWKQMLATPITGDFRQTPIREVINFIALKARANIVFHFEPGAVPGGTGGTQIPGLDDSAAFPRPPVFTAHFEHTPLRVVLYRLSRDTHLVVDWFYLPENPRSPQAIGIHNK
jgi:hypothetical protein